MITLLAALGRLLYLASSMATHASNRPRPFSKRPARKTASKNKDEYLKVGEVAAGTCEINALANRSLLTTSSAEVIADVLQAVTDRSAWPNGAATSLFSSLHFTSKKVNSGVA
jgi:hypothetical protein